MDSIDQSMQTVDSLRKLAGMMSAWLKFLAVANMLLGAFMVVTLIGILFAWLPIWIGVLLYQAGERASSAAKHSDSGKLVEMVDKLRLYFIINSVLTMFWLAFGIGFFIFLYAVMQMPADEFRGLMEYVF